MIELCAEMFPWATFRRTKGAVKLHCTLDHDGYLPTVVVITEGKRRETPVVQEQRFAPGTILVFDRGYLKVSWFAELNAAGVYFVTRLMTTRYRVIARRPVPQHRHILVDHEIKLCGRLTRRQYPDRLRRVVLQTPEGDRLEFLTNHLTLGASTVARIYQDRWQIELFFKALKQNLRVKTFVGTSANALHIQIWTALIALLLLKYLQLKARFGWSLSNLVALLRMNLFAYRDLWAWLNEPFTGPPEVTEPVQQALAFP
jgi:IS4 transposase